MTRLVLLLNGLAVREVPLKHGRNVVGRSVRADVFVDDPSTSREHCELLLGTDELRVRDLGATNGTYLDGRQVVGEATVSSGQRLRVGDIECEFRDVPARVAIPAPAPAAEPAPREMEDGTPCCVRHGESPAFFRCPTCGEQWCGDCVRIVGRAGGKRHAFCPGCHALCAFMPDAMRRERRAAGLMRKIDGMGRRFYTWLTTGP